MQNKHKKKICLVVYSLGGGGAEKSSALLSIMLSNLGHDVHIVSVLDRVDFEYKGSLLNLGLLKKNELPIFGRLKRLFIFRNYLNKNKFDFVIDNRPRVGFLKEFIISRFIYTPRKTLYYVRSFNTNLYIHSNRFLARWIYKDAYRLIAVSNGIAQKLKNRFSFNNVQVIYNPVPTSEGSYDLNQDPKNYIVFLGRLHDEVKNITLLINAYAESKLPDANVKLKIVGDGPDLSKLNKQVLKLNLQEHIEFLGYTTMPEAIVAQAKFSVLTSRWEGFPRAILESLSFGIPVISVDCNTGPKELIIDEFNGLMVKNHDVNALAKAMDRLYTDKKLYLQCRANASSSVSKFSLEAIAEKWADLL